MKKNILTSLLLMGANLLKLYRCSRKLITIKLLKRKSSSLIKKVSVVLKNHKYKMRLYRNPHIKSIKCMSLL
jgi:hypothetical protein